MNRSLVLSVALIAALGGHIGHAQDGESLSISGNAIVGEESSKLFSTIGEIAGFEYHAQSYKHKHHIYYYIPGSFKADGKGTTMVLLHGGGASTSTYASANKVGLDYLKDMRRLADKLGMPVIAPTSSIGWNYPTTPLMNEIVSMIRAGLNIDPDRIFLFGHSMGGMGITREAGLMTDLFSGFMPTAAGMQDNYQIQGHLKTYFNTRFVHINGETDHFTIFKYRALQVENKMKGLEEELQMKSGFQLLFHPGGHNYDLQLVEQKIREEIMTAPRDLYQRRIFPQFGRLQVAGSNNPIAPDINFSYSSYLWLQAELKQLDKVYLLSGEASCENNQYSIQLEHDGALQGLRVLVSSKMVDLSKPVSILLNGRKVFEELLETDATKAREIIETKGDRGYVFDTYVDIKL
jgi:hypothetical protein